MTTLVFIDTNILLDFYRLESREAGLSILDKIEQNAASIVGGDQVVMEFKKNRQKVILDVYKGMRSPDWGSLQLPPVLAESRASKALERQKKEVKATAERLRKRLENVLGSPSAYDPVYRAVTKLAKADGPYHLSRKKEIRFSIREQAQKRFLLGYPPRKPGDTSIGDAVNWEWIVQCAKAGNADIVIVTRDTDYGPTVAGRPILNDWLKEEFRARAGRKRKLLLTDRLAVGLKEASIAVSKKEAEAEATLVATQAPQATARSNIQDFLAAWTTADEDAWRAAQAQHSHLRRLSIPPQSPDPSGDK